eukprot:4862816-Pleurochrysis_carterae.AAC.1
MSEPAVLTHTPHLSNIRFSCLTRVASRIRGDEVALACEAERNRYRLGTRRRLISRDGRCGKKSLPTKKQRKMKSSIKRSRSNPPATEKSACSNSLRKYSRKLARGRKWQAKVEGAERRSG